MSGNFVQRENQHVLINGLIPNGYKQSRPRSELPVIYATIVLKHLPGAIQILQQTGIVNSLCFGVKMEI